MERIKFFFRKDNFAFGVLIALTLSLITYAILHLLSVIFPEAFSNKFLRQQVLVIISIFVNLFPFRTYMAGLKFDKTGRGILATMFVLTILYFIFIH